MPKYFLSGTRYEPYERMMMSPDRSGRDIIPPPKKKSRAYGQNTREQKKSVDIRDPVWYVLVLPNVKE